MSSIRFAGQKDKRQGKAVAGSDGNHHGAAKSEKINIESTEDFEAELRGYPKIGSDTLGLNLIGFKVVRRAGYKVHFCTCCDFPIAVYGQLKPCLHALCLTCAESRDTCHLCGVPVHKIVRVDYNDGLYLCGTPGCLLSFLDRSSFTAHVRSAHASLCPFPPTLKTLTSDTLKSPVNAKRPPSSDALPQPSPAAPESKATSKRDPTPPSTSATPPFKQTPPPFTQPPSHVGGDRGHPGNFQEGPGQIHPPHQPPMFPGPGGHPNMMGSGPGMGYYPGGGPGPMGDPPPGWGGNGFGWGTMGGGPQMGPPFMEDGHPPFHDMGGGQFMGGPRPFGPNGPHGGGMEGWDPSFGPGRGFGGAWNGPQ